MSWMNWCKLLVKRSETYQRFSVKEHISELDWRHSKFRFSIIFKKLRSGSKIGIQVMNAEPALEVVMSHSRSYYQSSDSCNFVVENFSMVALLQTCWERCESKALSHQQKTSSYQGQLLKKLILFTFSSLEKKRRTRNSQTCFVWSACVDIHINKKRIKF